MARLRPLALMLFGLALVSACGGDDGTDGDAKRSESSKACIEFCEFWAVCNSGEVEPGACDTFCDDQAQKVDADCLDLYAAHTSCEAENLNCGDRLGNACRAEFDAYYECESGSSTAEPDNEGND